MKSILWTIFAKQIQNEFVVFISSLFYTRYFEFIFLIQLEYFLIKVFQIILEFDVQKQSEIKN